MDGGFYRDERFEFNVSGSLIRDLIRRFVNYQLLVPMLPSAASGAAVSSFCWYSLSIF